MTIIYPRYNDIWSLLFWIGIFYMSIRALSSSNTQSKSLMEIINEIHISVKIAFALAIIIGLFEVFFGNNLVISTALMVLAIIFDIIFSRKKEQLKVKMDYILTYFLFFIIVLLLGQLHRCLHHHIRCELISIASLVL